MNNATLNQFGQAVIVKGYRKAIITKRADRKWSCVRGWKSEFQLSGETTLCDTKRAAVSYANDWLNDQ